MHLSSWQQGNFRGKQVKNLGSEGRYWLLTVTILLIKLLSIIHFEVWHPLKVVVCSTNLRFCRGLTWTSHSSGSSFSSSRTEFWPTDLKFKVTYKRHSFRQNFYDFSFFHVHVEIRNKILISFRYLHVSYTIVAHYMYMKLSSILYIIHHTSIHTYGMYHIYYSWQIYQLLG